MKICISTVGPDLTSLIDEVFGRCSYFLIVDNETGEFSAITNKAKETERGAGVAAAQIVVDLGAAVVLCGNIGPNAQTALEQAGIKVISGISTTAKSALDNFQKEESK